MKVLRGRAIGVALSETRILAVSDGQATVSATPLFDGEWSAGDPSRAQILLDAFRALRTASRDASALNIALLPPLAEIRLLDLPPLTSDELRPAISDDLSRFMPVSVVPHTVQVHPRKADDQSALAPRLISVAEEQLIEEILAGAAIGGWRVSSIVAAALAWEAAARSSSGSRAIDWVSVQADARVDSFKLGAYGIIAARRSSLPAEILPQPVHVLADDMSTAMVVAASHAGRTDAHSLWPKRVYVERSAKRWRESRMLFVASAFLLAIAGGVEWLSLSRAEAQISAERAVIRSEVEAALSSRDTLDSLQGTVRTIRDFESDAPPWLTLLESIGAALPEDAYLLSLRGVQDTIALNGEAERAAPVLNALSEAAGFRSVRVAAPIEQQVEAGEVISERFSILMLPRLGSVRP